MSTPAGIVQNGPASSSTSSPPSRWSLTLQAKALRYAASLGIGTQNYISGYSTSPTKTEYIDSTFGCSPAKRSIQLDIYNPPISAFPSTSQTSTDQGPNAERDKSRPCVIVFHGGGFVIGKGTDDSIFAKTSMDRLGAVVIGVSYRLSPEYPFPTPLEDCISSILHISKHSHQYGIDRDKIILAGFSAGGNLAMASHHVLHSLFDTSKPNPWGYSLPEGFAQVDIPKISGIVLFYPLLDYSIPREGKIKKLDKPEHALPDFLTRLFDHSYLPNIPRSSRVDMRISPALASDEVLGGLPPIWITVCEYDMLREEGIQFIRKLESLDEKVGWSEVVGEKHGWDKPPPIHPKASVLEEYDKALDFARGWLE